jgi:dephospho-CoA kinase
MQNKKLLVGISGGIGSGKTLASSFLEASGYKVIYADKVAKELYRTNKQLKAQIVREFGKGVLDAGGNIAGAGARKIILSNKRNIKRVNSIVHPFVRKEISRKISLLNDKIIFVEAAIMFDTGYYKMMDLTLLIYAPKKLRVKRVMQRDNITRKNVMKFMELQMDEREKLKLADFVVRNDGTKQKLFKGLLNFLDFISVIPTHLMG